MTTSHWRATAQRVIGQVLTETRNLPAPERLKQLDAAYPFGPREYYPYQVWLQERRRVMEQLGIPPKTRRRVCRVHHTAPMDLDVARAVLAEAAHVDAGPVVETDDPPPSVDDPALDRPHLRARPSPCLARFYGVVGTPVPMAQDGGYWPRNDPTLDIWRTRQHELLAEAEARGDTARAAWLRQVLKDAST